MNYQPTKRKRKLTKMVSFVKTMKSYIRHYEAYPPTGWHQIRFITANGEKFLTISDMRKIIEDNMRMIKELA